MNREHRIQFCQKCTKRSFSPKSGIVCSLTDAPAEFETTCPDYDEDAKEAKMIALVQEERDKEKEGTKIDPLKFEKKVFNGGIWGGVAAMVGSLIWFIAGIQMGRIFYYPIALFIFGTIGLIRGIIAKNAEIKKQSFDTTILDDDILDD